MVLKLLTEVETTQTLEHLHGIYRYTSCCIYTLSQCCAVFWDSKRGFKNEYAELDWDECLSPSVSNDPHLVYHRLDLVQPNDMCLHRHMPATSDTSTVFLSPKSFLDPFEHLSNLETKRMVQNYVAYLKDDTRLITNPGLKVRSVLLFCLLLEFVWIFQVLCELSWFQVFYS